MFTRQFIDRVINPIASHQPVFINGPIHFLATIFIHQPVLFNSLIAIIQLTIGILIINKRTIKMGLCASFFWGLFVWYIGEGLGGLFTGQATLMGGAPGAAALYCILSLAFWPTPDKRQRRLINSVIMGSWILIWIGGALLTIYNGMITSSMLGNSVSATGGGIPNWLAYIDSRVGSFVAGQGNWLAWTLIALEGLIAMAIFLPTGLKRLIIIIGLGLDVIFWLVGQHVGSLYSGVATDLNTAPVLFILGLVMLFMPGIKLNLFAAPADNMQ
jgi:hypothetical protein